MSKLKPCPFCGTDLSKFPEVMIIQPVRTDEYLLEKLKHKQIIGSDAGYEVRCCKCGSTGSRGMTRQEAAEYWNMRADDGSYQDILEYKPKGKE